jgi:hypothetical protein
VAPPLKEKARNAGPEVKSFLYGFAAIRKPGRANFCFFQQAGKTSPPTALLRDAI